MLATLGATPTGPGWGYEFKWDGVRAISYIEPFGARVLSRNDREVTGSYPELRETVRLLGDRQAVLDAVHSADHRQRAMLGGVRSVAVRDGLVSLCGTSLLYRRLTPRS